MSQEDLKVRLAYFEEKLAEAMRESAAKLPFPKKFGAGFTTEPIKDWSGAIAVIKERIAGIRKQLEKV